MFRRKPETASSIHPARLSQRLSEITTELHMQLADIPDTPSRDTLTQSLNQLQRQYQSEIQQLQATLKQFRS